MSGMTGGQAMPPVDESKAEAAVAAVMAADPGLSSVAAPTSSDASFATLRYQDVEAELDLENGGRVVMGQVGRPGEAIGLELQGSGGLEPASIDPASGIATYEAPEGDFTYVPVLRQDGTLQAHTVIDSADAPTRNEYTVEIPDGGRMEAVGTSVLIFNDGDEMVGGIAPAWAKDALGNNVPTHYEIDGAVLTQVVEHRGGSAYPVTADPWLGVNLFGHVYTDWTNGDMRVNARVSPWGLAVWAGGGGGGVAGGQAILNSAGWTEVRSRGADVRHALDKASQRQQFECHALASGFTGSKEDRWPQWNLEKWRPNRTVHWSYGVAVHRCNWKSADRY